MDVNDLITGLLQYLSFIILATFHEFGHAWMASKCGDDTAKDEGRISLNPMVHIDPIGTVLIPLLGALVPSAGPFLIGWARPVPVNPNNLRNPRLDDVLISFAGPWMNVLLAVVIMGLAKLALVFNQPELMIFLRGMAYFSMWLFFFNLLPIPPLDGSHILRALTGMTYETYWSFARFGFIALIIVINIPVVGEVLYRLTRFSGSIMAGWFQVG